MYRRGYFRQQIELTGWQREYWVETDPERLPAALVTGDGGEPLTITVPIYDAVVTAQIWRIDVGRVPLFLLDAERPENDRLDRWITAQLYVGDPYTRLAQYVLLGHRRRARAGGARHRARRRAPQRGPRRLRRARARRPEQATARRSTTRSPRASARSSPRTRPSRPATTPTRPSRSSEALGAFAEESGIDTDTIVRLGRTHPDDAVRAVRRDAVRAAHEPRGQRRERAPRRGRARDVAAAVAGPPGRARCRSGTSPTACTPRRGSARRCARCWTATSATDWMTRVIEPETWAAVDADPRRRAVGRAPRAACARSSS